MLNYEYKAPCCYRGFINPVQVNKNEHKHKHSHTTHTQSRAGHTIAHTEKRATTATTTHKKWSTRLFYGVSCHMPISLSVKIVQFILWLERLQTWDMLFISKAYRPWLSPPQLALGVIYIYHFQFSNIFDHFERMSRTVLICDHSLWTKSLCFEKTIFAEVLVGKPPCSTCSQWREQLPRVWSFGISSWRDRWQIWLFPTRCARQFFFLLPKQVKDRSNW